MCRVKHNAHRSIDKCEARLVVIGYAKTLGVNSKETFVLTSRITHETYNCSRFYVWLGIAV